MIIGACGYGATGSSVLTDLLKEYDDIQVYDSFEFWLSYRVDGLEDLEYHLMKEYAKNLSGDYAIKRFLDWTKCYKTPFINKPCNGDVFYLLSKNYIDSITQLKYKGVETADVLSGNVMKNICAFASKKILMPKVIEKIIHKPSFLWPCRTLNYCIEPENFYEETKKYVNNILLSMGADLTRPICLDQPFEGNCPEHSFPFFEDPYAVVIDRDPRDLYFDEKYTTSPDGKFFPRTNVKDFVIYYRNMRKNITNNSRVLRIRFEELIYEYEDSIKKIENFLHLGEHKRPKTGFIPERSINNTQQSRLHPEDRAEVEYIEKELKDFLFPFEKYSNVIFNGKPFYGAERNVTEAK